MHCGIAAGLDDEAAPPIRSGLGAGGNGVGGNESRHAGAIRTRQTLAPLIHRLTAPAPPILLEKGLYLAPEDVLLARLRKAPDAAATVLLIGHNDGIWRLAEALAGRGRPRWPPARGARARSPGPPRRPPRR